MMIGRSLGPYRILEKLGEGGMGEVYKATDTRLGRTVAIKVLPAGAAADPERRRRFEQEARAVSALNHPHICALYDVGHEAPTGGEGVGAAPSGRPIDFLVMEHLEGQTLAERLAKGALPLDQALQYGIQIAGGLARAHRHGILHRDLKPGNVMLTRDGAKLLDFGLAKLRAPGGTAAAALSVLPTADAPGTAAGTILGTVPYMAPEQLEGREADARADVFAFGCVLYEMLTGRRTFEGRSPASIMAAILEREPPPVSSLQPLTPPALDRVVKRCLAKDPDERWESAHDVAAELEWLRDAAPVAGVTATQEGGRRSWRLPGLALAFAAGAALVGAVAWWWPAPPAPPGRVLRFSIDLPSGRWTDWYTLSPDGRALAYVGIDGGHRQLYLRSFQTGADAVLAGTDGAFAPFFSPDGGRVGFFVRDVLMSVPVDGGRPTTAWQLPAGHLEDRGNSAEWLDDGTIVCSAGPAGLWRVPASGEGARRIASVDPARGERYFGRPSPLPDGKHVLVSVVGGAGLDPTPVVALSLSDGTRRTLADYGSAPVYVTPGHVAYLLKGRLVAAPFDGGRLAFTGPAVPVLEDVSSFSMSPGGELAYLALAPDPATALVRVDRRATQTKVADMPAGRWTSPSLSPDGRRLALHQVVRNTAALWVVDIDRGDVGVVAKDGDPHAPVWGADGQKIVFSAHRGATACNLFAQNADGTGQAEQLVHSPLHLDPGSMSADGRWLAYAESSPETKYDLSVLDVPSGRTTVFRRTPNNEEQPRISPDGAWLAYQSDETGTSEVYLEAFPGGGRKVKASLNGGTQPLWCRADGTLIYRDRTRLMSVHATNRDGAPVAGVPVFLLEGSFPSIGAFGPASYAASPDCQSFYFLKETAPSAAPARFNLVLGWIDEFKERLKGR
jgi:eukaryotic-like serine/threonine-protein kinase